MMYAMMILGALTGCMQDDWDGETDTDVVNDTDTTEDTDDTVITADGFVGSWRSEGADLSGLFAADPFNYERVDADFEANGDYTVFAVDADNAEYTLVGTYTLDDSTTPGTVSLHQSSPYEAIASGIWQLEDSDATLRYEVVQTTPDYGFVPPTPTSGFGSTTGPNLTEGVNVQVYRRR